MKAKVIIEYIKLEHGNIYFTGKHWQRFIGLVKCSNGYLAMLESVESGWRESFTKHQLRDIMLDMPDTLGG